MDRFSFVEKFPCGGISPELMLSQQKPNSVLSILMECNFRFTCTPTSICRCCFKIYLTSPGTSLPWRWQLLTRYLDWNRRSRSWDFRFPCAKTTHYRYYVTPSAPHRLIPGDESSLRRSRTDALGSTTHLLWSDGIINLCYPSIHRLPCTFLLVHFLCGFKCLRGDLIKLHRLETLRVWIYANIFGSIPWNFAR